MVPWRIRHRYGSDGDIDMLSASKRSSDVRIHSQYRSHFSTVSRRGTLLLEASQLRTEETDNQASHLINTLTDAPDCGSLRINGSSIAENDTFTQYDIDSNRLTYVHNGVIQTNDRFTFTVRDGVEDGHVPLTGTLQLMISS